LKKRNLHNLPFKAFLFRFKLLITLNQLNSLANKFGKNRFLVVEGINGSGKTTFINYLDGLFVKKGLQTLISREPGGSRLGGKLREILLCEKAVIDPLSEVFLFSADRVQHLNEIIKPALSQNKTVLCDRYYYSTIAFQSYGRGLDLSIVEDISNFATSGFEPYLTILLDLKVEIAQSRINKRLGGSDRFELEDLSFQKRVRDGYLDIAKNHPKTPFLKIDGEKSIDEIQEIGHKLFLELTF
jgi:dTMP kinase